MAMKKRWMAIFGSVLLGMSLLAGCSSNASSGSSSSSNGKVTLTFFYRWPDDPYHSYFQSVEKAFEKENPNVQIKEITAINDDYKQKANVLLGSQNPPDIFFTWTGEYGDKFIRDGVALDLTKYYQQDKAWSNQLISSQISQFKSNGKIYGVPLHTDTKLFFYNKDLFSKLGLSVPTTWSQFTHDLQVIKQSGTTTPLLLGNKDPWAAGHYVTALNQRMVPPSVVQKDFSYKGAKFTDPGYVQALQKLKELAPYMNSDPNALTHEAARNEFVAGKGAVIYLESMEISLLKDAKFNWGTFKMPAIEGGKGDQTGLIGAPEGFMVSSKSQHPDIAMKFLEFLTNKTNGEALIKDTGLASTVKGAVNSQTASPQEVDAMKLITGAKSMMDWTDSAIDTQIFNPYGSGVQALIGGQTTPQAVMKSVQQAAQQVVSQ
jgi:raffinose/stachyose/melibiose transport system substrate-binding protein